MDLQIRPARLSGPVTPPPSKSMAHRLLLAAALGGGTSIIRNVALSRDMEATLRCGSALGARWDRPAPRTVRVRGIGSRRAAEMPRFDCGESGSTLRFLIPVALAAAGGGVFTGGGRLMERPQRPYFDLFDRLGISHRQAGGELTVRGRLTPGDYRLPGDVSSQFFTGLLLALPLLDGPSTLTAASALESAAYVAMTLEALESAGVTVEAAPEARTFHIAPQTYRPFERTVEADWSQAAFWYAAAALGNPVEPEGLNPSSAQGDRAVLSHARRLTRPGDVEIDVSGCPDLAPPLAVMAAVRRGAVQLTGAARLRLKESDRLQTTAALVNALGGQAEEGADSLTIRGVDRLTGGTVDGANDHRIVMAAAIAATRCAGPVTILGAEAVGKSYPDFFEIYTRLGGDVHVL